MGRLTNSLRNSIRDDAMAATYEGREKAFEKQAEKLANECYTTLFDAKLRKAIAAVPIEWFRQDKCLRVNANGWDAWLRTEKLFSVPYSHSCEGLGSITGELAVKVQSHLQDKKAFEEEFRSAKHKLGGFLEQFNTFAAMEKAWPEGKKFYKKYDYERMPNNVPAVITTEINNMLGLKKVS